MQAIRLVSSECIKVLWYNGYNTLCKQLHQASLVLALLESKKKVFLRRKKGRKGTAKGVCEK